MQFRDLCEHLKQALGDLGGVAFGHRRQRVGDRTGGDLALGVEDCPRARHARHEFVVGDALLGRELLAAQVADAAECLAQPLVDRVGGARQLPRRGV